VVRIERAVVTAKIAVVMAKTEKAAADSNGRDGGRDGISEGTLVCK
jgi:hypothetical protein